MTQNNLEQNPWLATRTRTGAEYDAPYEQRELEGEDIHGEANLVQALLGSDCQSCDGSRPFVVLDAGCGTGRMGIELARRGCEVVGVDLDEVMLSQAQRKAPQIAWHRADLSTIQLDKQFDAVAMAGNVMIYLTPGTARRVLENMTAHLRTGGILLAAFELNPYPWTDLTIDGYDEMAAALGLEKIARWATWDQDAWQADDLYAVTLHRKPS